MGVMIACGSNLIDNSGFEEILPDGATKGWQELRPTYRIENGAGRNGSRGLVYENDDPDIYRLVSQKVDLQIDCLYRFSVWVRTESLEGAENGATVCLQWHDRAGKWLGGSFPKGVKGTHGWHKIEGSVKIPEGAAVVSVTPYVRKGMTGKAWFDDLELVKHIPPPVGVICSSAYRDTVAAHECSYFVELALAANDLCAQDVEAIFTLRAHTGEVVFTRAADSIKEDHAVITIDTARIAEGCYDVEFVLRTVAGEELGCCAGRMKRVAQMPERKVWIDAHKRVIVDGRPFFPLGMFFSGIKKDQLKIYAAGPFNCLMPYVMPSAEQVDMVHEAGLKIIYSLKDIYYGTCYAPKALKSEADEAEFVRVRVEKFKDHPALLAWYVNDELPPDMIGRLSARQTLMRELDPDHPTWVVLYQYNQVRTYIPSFDIVGTDPYPIPGKSAGMALTWSRVTRDQCWNARPFWQVPQVFDWAGYGEGADKAEQRAPTLDEMRTMAWHCIAAGANGLIFYSFFDLVKMDEKDPFEKRWREVCEMATEIRGYLPVLLSAESVSGIECAGGDQIEYRAWSYNNAHYLLIVNGSRQSAGAIVKLAARPDRIATEFGEAPVVSADGELQFKIDPLKPVLIRW